MHDGNFFNLDKSRVAQFLDVLLQSFISAAIVGIVFELAVWKFGTDYITAQLVHIKKEIVEKLEEGTNTLVERIPTLTATSIENISKLHPKDAAALIDRVLEQHSDRKRVANAASRIARSIIELDDRKVVVNLRNSVVIFESDLLLRTENSVSYTTTDIPEVFRFGVFHDRNSYDAYQKKHGQLDGYWIARKAFTDDGAYSGDLVYLSEFYITSSDGERYDVAFSAKKGIGFCVFSAIIKKDFTEATIHYKIHAFVSKLNPLIQISTPFVTDHMVVRVSCQISGLKEILHSLSVPFAGTVTFPEKSTHTVEVVINDVVFPGHGVLFSLRFE